MRILFLVLGMAAFGSCKTGGYKSDLDGTVVREDKTPSKVLFHYGEYQYINPYGDRTGTFTQAEWQSIPSVTKGQTVERRGLYVAQHLGTNDSYGQDKLYSKDGSWIAVIHISNECRNNHTSYYTPDDLAGSTEYKDFLKASEANGSASNNGCSKYGSSANCVAAYYDQSQRWIIFDSWWKGRGFWYIRKPECIEAIYTSPQKILQEVADLSEAWTKEPFTDLTVGRKDGWGDGRALVFVISKAIAIVKDPDAVVLNRIYESTKLSDLPGVKDDFSKVIRAAVACVNGSNSQLIQDRLMKFVNDEKKTEFKAFWGDLKTLGAQAEELAVTCVE